MEQLPVDAEASSHGRVHNGLMLITPTAKLAGFDYCGIQYKKAKERLVIRT